MPSDLTPLLQKEGASERAYLSFNLTADLTSLFSWNTKQVTQVLRVSHVRFM